MSEIQFTEIMEILNDIQGLLKGLWLLGCVAIGFLLAK